MKSKRIETEFGCDEELSGVVLKAAFVAYQFDQTCLDKFPSTKKMVVALSNNPEFVATLESITPHDDSIERLCLNALKARQAKPVPSMVDDTGNYDWPRYYSDNDTDLT